MTICHEAFGIRSISFSYPHNRRADIPIFRDFSATITSGSVTAIMGPSGSGKSTLGKLLAGQLVPNSGKIDYGAGLEPPLHRFYIDQDPSRVYFPWLTVFQNLSHPLRTLAWNTDSIRQRTSDLLSEMDLQALGMEFPAFLSGGQKSRLALARVLSWYPKSIVLDEYLADLDLATRRRVIDALRRYVRCRDMTVIVISHDASDVAALADRCLVLGGQPATIVTDIDLRGFAQRDPEDALRVLIHANILAQDSTD